MGRGRLLPLEAESSVQELVQRAVRLLGALPEVTERRVETATAALAINVSRGQARLPKSRREEMVAAYYEGLSHKVIAARFGVHRSTVTRVLRAAGIGPAGPVLPAGAIKEVRAFYAAGNSVVATAEHFSVSRKHHAEVHVGSRDQTTPDVRVARDGSLDIIPS